MPTDEQLIDAIGRYGTPVYVYDLAEIRVRVDELRAALPTDSRLLYSLKANPLPPLVAELLARDCGAEVSSPGELEVALTAGCAPEQVLYSGPGKTARDLASAVAAGIREFSCESSTDLRRLSAVAAAAAVPVSVLVRLQVAARPGGVGLSMSDGRQFGFEEADGGAACEAVVADEWLRLRGLHVYVGTQVPGAQELEAAFAAAAATMARVAAESDVRIAVADLGGGFPWPYAEPGAADRLPALRVSDVDRIDPVAAPELWFESGRRLVASAGVLATTVTDVKRRSEGATIVVADAGINALGGMSGLGRVLRPRTRFDRLRGSGEARAAEPVDVVGPLCTPLDRLAVGVPQAVPEVGEVLVVPNCGAYGLTASLTAFLSHPAPPEVVYDGDAHVGCWRLRGGHAAAGVG